jgi:hypothetical protein
MKQLAEQFRISKDYMKKLLRKHNPFPVTPRIGARLRELQTQALPPIMRKHRRRIIIYTKYCVPQVVHLYLQPRKCRGHSQPSIMSPNQVYCGTSKKQRAACEKLWRKKQRGQDKPKTKIRRKK